jgi:hypothetical protein
MTETNEAERPDFIELQEILRNKGIIIGDSVEEGVVRKKPVKRVEDYSQIIPL